jgi:hypothetical protein
MSIERVHEITVNNEDGSEYIHTWSRPAHKRLGDAFEEMCKGHPNWSSMVITIVEDSDD